MKRDQQNKLNHMEYLEGMEQTESDILEKVMNARGRYQPERYTRQEVKRALAAERRTTEDFGALLSPAAEGFLEEMAQKAAEETGKHFGNSVSLFTPLYISNYCENHCVYCGFHCRNQIHRMRLNQEEMEKEMAAIAKTGLEEILILTGESRVRSDVHYIGEACKIAGKYFKMVGLEVYPMNSEEYRYLRECGADYVTVFQETYDSDKYETLHPAGHKRVFPYRFHAQERALRGGMRGVAFGALLGLSDFRKDAFATGLHGYYIQRKYPYGEISFSCPRLRPIRAQNGKEADAANIWNTGNEVTERQLLQIMCAYRLFMPFAGITISTRERAQFRDHVVGKTATRISAGVSTGIGSHSHELTEQGDSQFEIADSRNVSEVVTAIRGMGLQPVMNDYVYV
ncbi:thiazole biosynthesis protein ThiH [Eubacterium sp. 14-2]|uniref:2-iminoacetate synthase ThiH n=1 Tax=Eubacterium sp. 14-2 TaxID=1235790 RepID=UPI00033FC55F|nr:2-iminoacetate synthase ThiH [Eubacterium sp. 14-2]EOT24587.1 thiazole biosynthesis protein ThiH [Eubacterium sp. 14-2]